MHLRTRRTLILVGIAIATLTGCITGERPTLTSAPTVDDPAAIAVLDRLQNARSVDFTASYRIVPSSSGEETLATVSQLGTKRRITIGEVVFTTNGSDSRTCANATSECVDFLDDARVSDLNLTNGFWGPGFRTRLELDASRRIGPSSGTAMTIAGQAAMCVDVIVPSAGIGGTVAYCALDAGVLARYFGADVSIELTRFTFEVSPNDFDD
jgi:hypothetical protein